MPLEAPVTMATLEFLEDASFVGIEEECDCMVVKVQLLLFVAAYSSLRFWYCLTQTIVNGRKSCFQKGSILAEWEGSLDGKTLS
jgi:hypothetical protein